MADLRTHPKRGVITQRFAIVACCVGLLGLPRLTHGQSSVQAASPLKLEVVSVKPVPSGTGASPTSASGNRFAATMSLRFLLRNAYRIQDFQISGAPDWIDSPRFSIEAKTEREFATRELSLVLQAVLADRFGLKAHLETRELPTYSLVVTKDGPKLRKPAQTQTPTVQTLGGRLRGMNASTGQLASILSSILERQVIDQTGIEGSFDFNMEWVPDPNQAKLPPGVEPNFDPNGVSIFTAIQEQLGLRLDSQKRPVEILVIDDIRRPGEN